MIPRKNLIRAVKKAIGQPRYAIKAFGQRAKSFLNYHLKDGFSSYPETISLFLTFTGSGLHWFVISKRQDSDAILLRMACCWKNIQLQASLHKPLDGGIHLS